MKKLNTYLMGMMSVAVCLFSVACSSDDEETTPQKDGKVVTVEAVFANDGVTRAVIGNPNGSGVRQLSFEAGDVLRLVGNDGTPAAGEVENFTATTSGGTKCHFYGSITNGDFGDYTAYLIPKGSTAWASANPSLGTVSSVYGNLQAAFTNSAVISGEYETDKYVLSLQNAFVVNNSTEKANNLYYNDVATPVSLPANGGAVAVAKGVILKKAFGNTGTSAEAKTIYVFN